MTFLGCHADPSLFLIWDLRKQAGTDSVLVLEDVSEPVIGATLNFSTKRQVGILLPDAVIHLYYGTENRTGNSATTSTDQSTRLS